jgi:hypothetical protein
LVSEELLLGVSHERDKELPYGKKNEVYRVFEVEFQESPF